jgi:hypothetical protein
MNCEFHGCEVEVVGRKILCNQCELEGIEMRDRRVEEIFTEQDGMDLSHAERENKLK